MDWRATGVSADGTHHTLAGKPIYAARYRDVLKFHAPGLAPVFAEDGATHIDVHGRPAYACRFKQAFGFYEGLAAVETGSGWAHVRPDGTPAYAARFAWCGNFQGGFCPVRCDDGSYHHIDHGGTPLYDERWAYAGDFRDGIAVVQAANGLSTHIDHRGQLIHGRWFRDLDVFHKGFARARDRRGWMHVDRDGRAAYGRRFAAVEPFYNGRARVERSDGGMEVIDDRGQSVVELRPATETPLQRLSGQMVGFWSTQTIRAGVELGVFDALPGTADEVGRACSMGCAEVQRILRALWELDLVAPCGRAWVTTETGLLLCGSSSSGMPEAAMHWATEHYRAWEALGPALKDGGSAFSQVYGDELFPWLAERPDNMIRFQAAMLAYAEHDYADLHKYIDVEGVQSVIDAGGGTGVLITNLLRAHPQLTGTVLDLPAVASRTTARPEVADRLSIQGADLLEVWPCTGDLVVLARVLHDWPDETAALILGHAKRALHPGGRVVLVEWVLSEDDPGGGMLDLNMAALCGSKERTEDQWRELATTAGLRLAATQSLPSYGCLIELAP